MESVEVIKARGHANIRATHGKTLEVTKETHLTPRGDCIIAVGADRGLGELEGEFKNALRNPNAVLEMTIECGGLEDKVTAYGHPKLTLNHPTDMVVRKSEFVCDRTLAVRADKAAADLNRKLVEKLAQGGEATIKLKVCLGGGKD